MHAQNGKYLTSVVPADSHMEFSSVVHRSWVDKDEWIDFDAHWQRFQFHGFLDTQQTEESEIHPPIEMLHQNPPLFEIMRHTRYLKIMYHTTLAELCRARALYHYSLANLT